MKFCLQNYDFYSKYPTVFDYFCNLAYQCNYSAPLRMSSYFVGFMSSGAE